MEMVFNGELVLVDWKSLLETYSGASLSRSNGELMVHIPEGFLFENYTSHATAIISFGFYPLAGW